MAELKKSGQLKKLVVAGCLTQRYKDELVEGLPEADLFVGSGEFQAISSILRNRTKAKLRKDILICRPIFSKKALHGLIHNGIEAYLRFLKGV